MTTATPAPPSARDETADLRLLRRFSDTRDLDVRAELVARYLPLARYAANRYARGSEPFDDLVQVASLGLLKAIDRFDPGNGATFSSYALPTMMGELRRHFRDRGWAVRPPRTLQEHALQVERAAADLERTLGRAPAVGEIAVATHLSAEEVLEAREAAVAHGATSLSAPIGVGEDAAPLSDVLGAEDEGFARADDRATVDALVRTLTRRERTVLRLRMEHDLTQSEIGALVGLSQMHVSRVLRQILEKLHVAAARRARETREAQEARANGG